MRDCILLVGTEDGLRALALSSEAEAHEIGRGAEGHAIRAIAVNPARPQVVFAGGGLRGWGLHRSEDGGRTFTSVGFEDRWVWDVSFHPADPEAVYVGTEPPMVWVSRDGGSRFEPLAGIEDLPSRSSWSFFYEPFGQGHVHGFGLHPDRPERIAAGVEVGGFIASDDRGKTWREALPGHDVHRVAVDPARPDRLLAATGEGLFESVDAGRTWEQVPALGQIYLHVVRFDPFDPRTVWVAADEAAAPLYRSVDGGRAWDPVGVGRLPDAGATDALAFHPTEPRTSLCGANVSKEEGRLFISRDAGTSWTEIPWELPRIWRMVASEGS